MNRYAFLIFFIAAAAVSQETDVDVRELHIRDFSGGLVNTVSNALMQNNQALVLVDYDIINGKLKRPSGYTGYHNAALNRYPIQALLPYVAPQTDKDLLVLMAGDYFPFNQADSFISVIRICNEATSTCTTLVTRNPGFLGDRRNRKAPYNVNSSIINNRLLLATTGSELRIWDGNKMFPTRPRAAGQPYAIPLDGNGNTTGIFSYRLLFFDEDPAYRYSELGPPSWPIRVKDGDVFIGDLGPVTIEGLQDSAAIYRSKNGGPYQLLVKFDTFLGGNGVTMLGTLAYYVDTAKETNAADTLPYPYGYHKNCIQGGGSCNSLDSVPAPGEMQVKQLTAAAPAGYGVTFGLKGLTDSTCVCFAYSVIFIDTSVRESYASPPACLCYQASVLRGGGGNAIKDSLSSIPIPWDNNIKKKILLRHLVGNIQWKDSSAEKLSRLYPCYVENGSYFEVKIDGFPISWTAPSSGTTGAMVVDSMTAKINASDVARRYIRAEDSSTFIHVRSAVPGQGWNLTAQRLCKGATGTASFVYGEQLKQGLFKTSDYIYRAVVLDTLDAAVTSYIDSIPYDSLAPLTFWCEDSTGAQEPTQFCYDDSAITFQPSDIAYFKDRLFAIGDLDDKNMFWYSDFGRPETFPPDHFLTIGSDIGDWLVRVLDLGEVLLLFRQHSIFGFSGTSFYQYTLQKLASGIGLSAPRSLSNNLGQVRFLHKSGVYEMSLATGIPDVPISWTIQNSIDSSGLYIHRGVGRAVGDEYWLSLPINDTINNKTYLYSTSPVPHWRSYSFGFNDIVLFDKDTLNLDFATNKFIFVSGTDSLYQWGGVTPNTYGDSLIKARYQSRYFFDEGEAPVRREKIFSVDFFGKHIGGANDTLMVYFYEQPRGLVDSAQIRLNFNDRRIDRVVFNRISDNCSIGWRSTGVGIYEIHGYTIRWKEWDTGRKQP